MKIKCVFESDTSKVYNVTTGSIFKDVIDGTLKSAVIRLDNIEDTDRLFSLKIYDYVCVYSEDRNFVSYYIVDNYVENQVNLTDKLWAYTINLMSEAKWLEKWQCPNLKITNSLVTKPLTIADYINRYCSLYIKKVKFTSDNATWKYVPMISWEEIIKDPIFNVACPDMGWNAPTLKQVITDLMAVVGCIPTINNRVLGYINLRAKPTLFNKTNVNYITRSMASDSYVNSLITQGDNIIDNNNLVINETIGFRDRNNVFLKQTENLKLNTKQKIYSINSCELNVYLQDYFMKLTNVGREITHNVYIYATKKGVTNNFVARLQVPTAETNKTLTGVVIKVLNIDTAKSIAKVVSKINLGSVTATSTDTDGDYYAYEGYSADTFNYVSVECYYLGTFLYFNQYIAGNTDITDITTDMYLLTKTTQFVGLYKKDMTPLVVEQSKRQLLDTDFLKMSDVTNIDDLAKYYYGTVGYAIGDTEISGFSQTYAVSNGWWTSTKTYIENILKVLLKSDNFGKVDFRTLISTKMAVPYSQTTITSGGGQIYNISNISDFANVFFNITYTPMNSLSVKYAKEVNDIPVEIEQLDTQEASVPSFDTMSEREIEKVNRLGNNLYQIHASFIDDLTGLNGLNTYIDFTHNDIIEKVIVFSREISVFDDFIEVNYVATQNYILKNYFTSIQTKYRAYEYVAYDKAVERKENVKVYALIDKFYINADDKVWCGNFSQRNARNEKSLFLTGAIRKTDTLDNLIRYTYEGADSSIFYFAGFKNEVSLPNFKSTMCFSFKDYDNVSQGNYIKNVVDSALGGLPQGWYLWNASEQLSRVIGFFSGVNLVSDYPVYSDYDLAGENLKKIYADPQITTSYSPNSNNFVNIFVVDNNFALSDKILFQTFTLYKDQAELLNFTLQIDYYTTSSDIKWTSKFISLCELTDYTGGNKYNEVLITDNLALSEYEQDGTSVESDTNVSNYLELITTNKDLPYLKVKWSTIPTTINYFKIINRKGGGVNYYDVIAFYRNGATTDTYYYISFNDTKTLKVYNKNNSNSLWGLNYYVDTDTPDRTCSESVSNNFKPSLVSFEVSEESIVDFEANLVYFTTESESV